MNLYDKELVLEDFRKWSGGFMPEECSHLEIVEYLNFGLPGPFRKEDVEPWIFGVIEP